MDDFDVVIIGSGTAAQNVVEGCAEAGLRLAVIDRLPFGGTCAQRGCDPKKVLLAAAEAVQRARGLSGLGLVGEPGIDWPALVASKRTFTKPVAERVEGRLRHSGVETYRGEALVVGEGTIEVVGRRLRARHIVVATGARPATLGIVGDDLVTTSDAFMELDELPARLVFVGGGYVSFEFAWLARAAGAEVTVVHREKRVLKRFDAQLSAALVERYGELGIRVLTEAPAAEVRRDGDGLHVVCGRREIVADLVVHGAGRVADVAGLGLEAAGVAFGPKGVRVDDHLRSVTNPYVWAAGDAADLGAPLTPVASQQGKIVAANVLGQEATFDGRLTPSVVFSDPPLAAVGLSTEAAETRSDLEVRRVDTSSWFTQRRLGETRAGAAIVSEKSTGELLGAHLLGVNAEELINVFAVAMHGHFTGERLAAVMRAYPTAASDIPYLV